METAIAETLASLQFQLSNFSGFLFVCLFFNVPHTSPFPQTVRLVKVLKFDGLWKKEKKNINTTHIIVTELRLSLIHI